MAKKVAATNRGFFKIFWNTMLKITVATGRAKNINKLFNYIYRIEIDKLRLIHIFL